MYGQIEVANKRQVRKLHRAMIQLTGISINLWVSTKRYGTSEQIFKLCTYYKKIIGRFDVKLILKSHLWLAKQPTVRIMNFRQPPPPSKKKEKVGRPCNKYYQLNTL